MHARRWPCHRGEGYRPFFVLGAPRSGNTLLRRIIQAGEGVHIPPELPVLRHVIKSYQKYNHLPWDLLLNMTLGEIQSFERYKYFGVSLQPLRLSMRKLPEKERSLARILDTFYRYHAEQIGVACRVWGDKTPLSRYAVWQIVDVFPDARFVHILRDGVDVVRSMLTDLEHAGYNLTSAAEEWADAVNIMRTLQSRRPGSVYELRYEQLVTDPEPVVRGLYAFLGLEYSPSVLDRMDHLDKMGDVPAVEWHATVKQPIFTASIGKGRREFSAEDKRVMQAAFNGALEREGYKSATAQ